MVPLDETIMPVEGTAMVSIHDTSGAPRLSGRFGGRSSLFLLLTLLLALGTRASDLALVGGTVYPDPDAPAIRDAVVFLAEQNGGRLARVG